jgi:hypothetical protein
MPPRIGCGFLLNNGLLLPNLAFASNTVASASKLFLSASGCNLIKLLRLATLATFTPDAVFADEAVEHSATADHLPKFMVTDTTTGLSSPDPYGKLWYSIPIYTINLTTNLTFLLKPIHDQHSQSNLLKIYSLFVLQ